MTGEEEDEREAGAKFEEDEIRREKLSEKVSVATCTF